MGEVKVIGLYASFPCVRVLWALKLKGVTYDFIQEDLLNKSPLLLQMNPVYKKVPVLIHDNRPIVESLLIVEYIDDTWNTNASQPLMPQDPYDRATARFWAKFVDEKVVSSVYKAMISEGEEKEAAIVAARETIQLIEKQIEGKKWFGVEGIGYLDLVVGWMSLWLCAMEEVGGMKVVDSIRFPCLTEWSHNFIKVAEIQECLPPKENAVDYFQAGLDYVRSLSATATATVTAP